MREERGERMAGRTAERKPSRRKSNFATRAVPFAPFVQGGRAHGGGIVRLPLLLLLRLARQTY